MSGLLAGLSTIAVDLFAIASMASVGLGYTVREIVDPLRDMRAVALALVANFAMVPLFAILILRLLALDVPYVIGLMLVAAAAGAPSLVKLTQVADGDVAFSSGILVLLVLASIPYMSLLVPHLVPQADETASAIARPLALTMLLPLALSLALRAVVPQAGRLLPFVGVLANVALVTLVVLTFSLNLHTLMRVFGTGALAASLLLVIGAFAIGWIFGGFGEHLRDEMALATAHRGFAAALVVATGSFEHDRVLVMVVVASLVTTATLFPAAKLLSRHVGHRARASG